MVRRRRGLAALLVVCGACWLVVAAALVSPKLGAAALGVFLLVAGLLLDDRSE
jgi:hypothetical protein